jgi:hypothetical protein
MALRNEIKTLLDVYKDQKCLLDHNEEVFDIFEGDLETYILKDLKNQLSEQAFKEVRHRLSPINILLQIIDKLSKIYAKAPVRKVINGSAQDEKNLTEWIKSLDIDNSLGARDGANGLFNLFKNVFVEPYLEAGSPKLRVIPSDRFFVYSSDKSNPMNITHFVKVMGSYKDQAGQKHIRFDAYTKDEFVSFNDDEKVIDEVMKEHEIVNDVNPLGTIPGVYVVRSKYNLMPKRDSDTLRMTKLIPIMLSDLNYALMYQCFSILYTIDCDQTGIKFGPNVIIDLKSDGISDKDPKIGMIKPEVDSDKALALIRTELQIWMQARNIRPGAMGDLTVQNAASAISKVVDEMDTSADRQAQVPYFQALEAKLFPLLFGPMHEYWKLTEPEYALKGLTMDPKATVETTFAEQKPIVDSTKAIGDQKSLMELKLQTRRGALKELYPDWSDDQVDQRMKEIDEEEKALVEKHKAQGLNPDGTDPNAPAPSPVQPKPGQGEAA